MPSSVHTVNSGISTSTESNNPPPLSTDPSATPRQVQFPFVTRYDDYQVVVNLPRPSSPDSSIPFTPPPSTPPSVPSEPRLFRSIGRQHHHTRNLRPRRQSTLAGEEHLGRFSSTSDSNTPFQLRYGGPVPFRFNDGEGNASERWTLQQQQQQQYRVEETSHSRQSTRAIAPASAAPMPAPDPTGPTSPYNFATQPLRVQQQQQAAVYNQQQQTQHPANRPQSQSQLQLQPQPRARIVQSFTANNLRSSHGSGNGSNSNAINNSGVTAGNSAFANSLSNNVSPSLHPQFRAKAVCRLTCKSCLSDVCMRGMKAILLADSRVELYSTDRPPRGVQLVYDDYRTRNCKCRIRDVACLGCGNTLGYHVTQPCESCLEACNNGHFWMFHSDGVSCTERYLPKSHSRPSSSSSSSSSSTAQGMTNESTSALSSDSGSNSNNSSRRRSRSRRSRRRRTWQRGSEGSSTQSPEETPDLSFRRRTSIHDMEYNRAVGAGPRANSSAHNDRHDQQGHGGGERRDDHADSGEYGNGDDDDDDNVGDEENDDTEDDNDDEEEEEKPVVMLWAALHAQEERYLHQMQQELMIQQQQQLLMQQRYLERQRQLEAQQQDYDPNQEQEQAQEQHQEHQRVSALAPSFPAVSPPTVGSRYHSMISAAISNASMMLWDEGRSLNQYDKLCR